VPPPFRRPTISIGRSATCSALTGHSLDSGVAAVAAEEEERTAAAALRPRPARPTTLTIGRGATCSALTGPRHDDIAGAEARVVTSAGRKRPSMLAIGRGASCSALTAPTLDGHDDIAGVEAVEVVKPAAALGLVMVCQYLLKLDGNRTRHRPGVVEHGPRSICARDVRIHATPVPYSHFGIDETR
jgi:hypothetical protein